MHLYSVNIFRKFLVKKIYQHHNQHKLQLYKYQIFKKMDNNKFRLKSFYKYYVLFKKNDPKLGGTTYLQSKVYAAKQVLMQKFTDAAQLQQQFYKEVVQPQQKAQQQERKKQEEEKKAESDKAAQNKQKQKNKKE